MWRPVPQTPAATTSSTTSPGPAAGSGRSLSATLPTPGASFVRPSTSLRGRGRAGVDRRERQHDQAVDDLAHGLRRVEDREEGVEDGQDESAEDGAGVAAETAED